MADRNEIRRLTIWPPAQWLRSYQRGWLMPDVVAGVTLAAYAIPVSLAYATLAGLPPHCGIYCYLLGGVPMRCLAHRGNWRLVQLQPSRCWLGRQSLEWPRAIRHCGPGLLRSPRWLWQS